MPIFAQESYIYVNLPSVKTASCKAKGRRAALEVKELLYQYWKQGQEGDIQVTSSSVPGPDIHLSPEARKIYPVVIEVKNQEKLNIWDALQQVAKYKKENCEPILFFKRNHSKLFAAIDAEILVKIISAQPRENPEAESHLP